MNAKEKRVLVYQEMESEINSCRKVLMDRVTGRQGPILGHEFPAYQTVGDALKTPEALQALDDAVKETLELFAHGLMCVLDGSGGSIIEHFELALVDWDAKENLRPRNGEYHGELAGYLMYGREGV